MLGCGAATAPPYVGSGTGGRQSDADGTEVELGVPAEDVDEPVEEEVVDGWTAEYDGSPCGC